MSADEPDTIADVAVLTDIFKQAPMRQWPVEDIAKDKIMRFAQTYLMMARAGYRPAAPNDGFGNIQLSREQFEDRGRLYMEAVEYALKFNREEDSNRFWIGCSDYATNRAFVLCIEAARLLAGGKGSEPYAVKFFFDRQFEQEVKR